MGNSTVSILTNNIKKTTSGKVNSEELE